MIVRVLLLFILFSFAYNTVYNRRMASRCAASMLAFSSKRVLLPRSRSTATASLSLSLSSSSARVFAAHRRTFLTEKFRKVMYGEEEDGGETK